MVNPITLPTLVKTIVMHVTILLLVLLTILSKKTVTTRTAGVKIHQKLKSDY